jgi:hypothetical protein
VVKSSNQQASAYEAVEHDHQHGEHRVAGNGRIGVSREQEGHDHGNFDQDYAERED